MKNKLINKFIKETVDYYHFFIDECLSKIGKFSIKNIKLEFSMYIYVYV